VVVNFQYIKQYVNIVDLLQRLGVKQDVKGKYHCPFHDDQRASASVKNNYLHCFVCNETWRPVELVRDILRVSWNEAVEWLVDEYELDREQVFKKIEEKKKIAKNVVDYEDAILKLWWALVEWIKKQGITDLGFWYHLYSHVEYIWGLVDYKDEVINKHLYLKQVYERMCEFVKFWRRKVEGVREYGKNKSVKSRE